MKILRHSLLSLALLLPLPLLAGLDETRPDYWLSPSDATQDAYATLWFDASATRGPLTDSNDDIYLYCGISYGKDNLWNSAPGRDNLPEKYKMTRSDSDRNLYYMEFSPSIAEWFGVPAGTTATHLNLIFRNASGTKHFGKDQFLTLATPPEPDPSASELGKMTGWESDGTTVTFTGERGALTVTPYGPEIVKIFTLPNNDTRCERHSISVCAEPEAEFSVDETEETVDIRITGGITVSVNRKTLLVSFLDSKGERILAERQNLKNSAGNVSHQFMKSDDIAFYGGGYNGSYANLNNQTLRMDNSQQWVWDAYSGGPRNINIPFCLSTSGYGILFDNHYRGATLTPSSEGTSYNSSSSDPVAYYFVGGGTMEKVLANYTILTGRQKMPPYWALGYISSRYGYHSADDATQAISSIKNMGLPLDGIVFDLYWEGEDESGMGNLDWYAPNFPNPKGMMKSFLDQGVHTVAITEPYFTNRCSNYSFLENNGYLADNNVNNMSWLKSDRVGLLDATNPEAVEWMYGFYRARMEEGMSGWWLDLGEPEQHDYDSRHAGGTVDQVHNEFGNLWTGGIYESLLRDYPDRRHLLMPRAGTAGMQRFSTFPWTGDIARSWEGLQAQVPALINASMSGVGYLGSDCGGFAAVGESTIPHLYLRWMEFAAFSPSMRTHSAILPEPYHQEYSSVADGIRKFVNLRYQYLPYTYTLSWANTYYGEPLARPANFADSDPSILASCKDAYLWGPDIFVAPVMDDSESRSITFPEGKWLDLNNFESVYLGHRTVSYSADLSTLPYFGRYGAFIPRFTQSSFTNTAEALHDNITVDFIYDKDHPSSIGYLYDDDHSDPNPVENNNYTLTTFRSSLSEDGYLLINADRSGTTHTASPEVQRINIVVHGYNVPDGTPAYAITIPPASEEDEADTPSADEDDTEAPAAAPRREKEDQKLPLYPSPQELLDAHADGVAYNDGKYYVSIGSHPAHSFVISIGGNGLESGLDELPGAAHIHLSYAGGKVQYAVPEGYAEASLSVWTPDGTCAARAGDLAITGMVEETSLSLLPGIYILRLDAEAPDGTRNSKTIKLCATR